MIRKAAAVLFKAINVLDILNDRASRWRMEMDGGGEWGRSQQTLHREWSHFAPITFTSVHKFAMLSVPAPTVSPNLFPFLLTQPQRRLRLSSFIRP